MADENESGQTTDEGTPPNDSDQAIEIDPVAITKGADPAEFETRPVSDEGIGTR